MRQYNRIMPGRGGEFAEQCRQEGFIGVDYDLNEDLTNNLPEDWHDFNKHYVPILQEVFPDKSKTALGLFCGFLYTVCKGLKEGDIVLSPDGTGFYNVGIIDSGYYYAPGEILPHRRKVKWIDIKIKRTSMSNNLKHSTGSIGACCDITKYANEIEALINGGNTITPVQSTVKRWKD